MDTDPAQKSRLRRERERRGWTLDFAAQQAVEVARLHGLGERPITANVLSRYERGKIRRPHPPNRKALALLYGRLESDLWPGRFASSLEPGPYATLEDMDRRTLLVWIRNALGVAVLSDGPDRLVTALERFGTVDAAGVDAISGGIANARRIDDTFGAEAATRPALAQYALLARLLRRSHPEEVERQLLVSIGQARQLLGWLAFDLGAPATALRYYRETEKVARDAGHVDLRAYALGLMGTVLNRTGRLDDALSALEEAAWLAPNITPQTRAYVACASAEAHAKRGDESASLRAMERAESATAEVDSESAPSWLYYWTSYEPAWFKGICLRALGKPDIAATTLGESLALLPLSMYRERAPVLVDLAAARAAQGEAEEASRLGGEALAIALNTDSARTVEHVRALRRQLDPWASSPAVRELDERLHAI